MSDLSPEDEALLRHARLGLEPTSADRARIKRGIAARLVIGAATSALSATTSAGAGASVVAGTTVATTVKLLGAVLVVGGLTGAVVLRASHRAPVATTRAAVTVTAPSSPVPAAPPAPSATPARGAAVPVPPPPAPTPRRGVARAPTPSAVAPNAIEPTLPSGPTTVAAEARLLREADTSLRAGDGARALALLNEHAASFPSGILVEERDAERVAVLCALGRTAEARTSASAFLRDHARSPLAVRVRGSCAGP